MITQCKKCASKRIKELEKDKVFFCNNCLQYFTDKTKPEESLIDILFGNKY